MLCLACLRPSKTPSVPSARAAMRLKAGRRTGTVSVLHSPCGRVEDGDSLRGPMVEDSGGTSVGPGFMLCDYICEVSEGLI